MEKEQQNKLVLVLIAALALFLPTFAQFPRRCTDKSSITSRECCPTAKDGSQCGEASKRGACSDIPLLFANLTLNESLSLLLDDRAWWPRAFFDRACHCAGNFDGVDCFKCKPGFEGTLCKLKAKVKKRRNIMHMTIDELERFINIVDKAKKENSENYVILTTSFDQILFGEFPSFRNISIYDEFVWMHYYVTRDNLLFSNDLLNRVYGPDEDAFSAQENRVQIAKELLATNPELILGPDVDYAHEGPAFLPWHRYFMLKWEIEISETVAMDPEFSLPYWDWRDLSGCDICNDLMFGSQRLDNQSLISLRSFFSEWRTVCTKGNDYMLQGNQCTGEAESFIERNPGNYDPVKISGLPTSNEVSSMFETGTSYDTPAFDRTADMSLRNILEGFANPNNGIRDVERSYIHNAVHLYMNGTMSAVDTSANDPIFIVHHVFVDSLFETWLREQPRGNNDEFFENRNSPRLGHRLQDFMVPFFPLVQNRDGFAYANSLGYEYDYLEENESSLSNNVAANTALNVAVESASVEGSAVETMFSPLLQNNIASKFDYDSSNLTSWTDSEPTNVYWHVKPYQTRIGYKKKKEMHKYHHHHWHRPRYGEGEGRLKHGSDINEKKFISAAEQDLVMPDEAVETGAWEALKQGFDDVNNAFRNMSREDIAWLVVAGGLVLGCVFACICMFCSRSRNHKRNRSCCSCCRPNDGEEEEYYALLDTGPSKARVLSNDGKRQKKIVIS